MTNLQIVETGRDLTDDLGKYFAICNDIVACNRERFPFAQIWRAMEDRLGGRPVEFVIAHHEGEAQQWVVFSEGKIHLVNAENIGLEQLKAGTKKISLPYLFAVLDDPSRHIANPALVDWDWVFTPSLATKQ